MFTVPKHWSNKRIDYKNDIQDGNFELKNIASMFTIEFSF